MAEREQVRANIPSSPACGQWETLLVDALDGLLRPEDEIVFSSHMANCAACTEMFEEARRGREWLEFLAPEPEVPAHLLDKILVETGHGKLDLSRLDAGKLAVAGGVGAAAGNVLAMPPVWQRPGFATRMRRFAEPRLMMTAAMAFFSIALTMSMVGARLNLRISDLRPTAVRSVLEKRIMTASTPIVRYYDHLRFVYEVESRMRELRRSSESQQQNQAPSQNKSQPEGESHRKDGGSKLNPNEAPQQTVNPPISLWGSDILQARLEEPRRLPARKNETVNVKSGNIKGFPTLTAVPSLLTTGWMKAGSIKIRVLAMPKRSNSCLA
jgi:Putative zinc-finger